jgi:uncharacterized protein (TIGR03083 family)
MPAQIPIETIHLFEPLDEELIALLRSLSPDDWDKPVVAKLWTVKDVASHLLDGNVRTLSMSRDNYFGVSPGVINSNEDLVAYLNKLNADWVHAMKRVSPAVLTELLEITGKKFCAYFRTLDPFDKAIFSVGWAGEDESANWFHIAREYTEKWHHQQQIREAVNKPGIMTRRFYAPFLDTFMQALPYTYRNTPAAPGTVIKVTITGEGGGDWYLTKKDTWELSRESSADIAAHTTIAGNVAWKLFSKSWRREQVERYVSISGDRSLGDVVLDMVSVMA